MIVETVRVEEYVVLFVVLGSSQWTASLRGYEFLTSWRRDDADFADSSLRVGR
jgi:hypothetical protein